MKVNKLILFGLLVAMTSVAQAQTPWWYVKQATDVWPGADAKAALVLGDGILTVGEIGLLDIMEGEVLMVKTDMAGNVIWEQSHDKPGSLEVVNRIAEVPSDGGFLVSTILIGSYRPWFFKTDADGNMLWESSAWTDGLPENSASQTYAFQLSSGDVACVYADDIGKYYHVYTLDNTTGSYISTDSVSYDLVLGQTCLAATTSDIINVGPDYSIFITRFTVADSTLNLVVYINDLGELTYQISFTGYGNFYPNQVVENAFGQFIISGSNSVGFFGANYEAAISIADPAGFYVGTYNIPGDLINSTGGDLMINDLGKISFIRYNYNGAAWDMNPEDYVEVVDLDFGYAETGSTVYDYAPHQNLEFITNVEGEKYITGGTAWNVGDPAYYLVIGTGADGSIPDCIFNCVWPGDADNSGMADMDDILAIGLGYGFTGDARADAGNDWYAHYADEWATALPSGVNHKYTDCNGDGVINDDDTTAVSNNFSLEHAVYTMKTAAGEIPLIFAPDAPIVIGENNIPILLGDAVDMVDEIYGLRFTAYAEGADVDTESIQVNFNDSFIGNTADLLTLTKKVTDMQASTAAEVKKDHTNSNGYGQIGTLSFVVIDNIAGKITSSTINLRFENVRAINVDNDEISIATSDLEIEVSTAINTYNNPTVQLFPNPVMGTELFIIAAAPIESVQIINVVGQTVYYSTTVTGNKINIPQLPNGQYLVSVQTQSGIETHSINVAQQ